METSVATTTPSAGEAPRQELERIMTDSSHPMYDGYKRNDAQVHTYLDGLYRKAYPTTMADPRQAVGPLGKRPE